MQRGWFAERIWKQFVVCHAAPQVKFKMCRFWRKQEEDTKGNANLSRQQRACWSRDMRPGPGEVRAGGRQEAMMQCKWRWAGLSMEIRGEQAIDCVSISGIRAHLRDQVAWASSQFSKQERLDAIISSIGASEHATKKKWSMRAYIPRVHHWLSYQKSAKSPTAPRPQVMATTSGWHERIPTLTSTWSSLTFTPLRCY